MGMNSLKANSMSKIPNLGDKEHENSTATEQTLSLEAENKTKKMVHQFYFVKFRPYKDPDEASKILEAERIIRKLDQKYVEMLQKDSLKFRIGGLHRQKLSILSGLEGEKKMLDHLKLLLDKLNLATKIPHKHKAGLHYTQGIKNYISHGSSNLVIERKLLKDMARCQHRLNDLDLSSSRALDQFSWCSNWGRTNSQMLAKLREIEERKNKALSDYAEKPNTFDPLILRNAIEEQIQIVKKISLELKVEQREIGPAIERLMKELIPITEEPTEEFDPMKQESFVSYDERREISKQTRAAQRCILKLRQTTVEMNGMYDEYVSLLSNAGDLARNEDIAALKKLSHHQVEEFMSKWNSPNLNTFRANYEINIFDSLRNRQLSNDGRMEYQDDDEETLRYIEDGSSVC